MALFKKRKEEIKTEEKKETEEAKRKVDLPQGKAGFAYRIIDEPVITEKAVNLSKDNQYVFRVFPRSNKKEIKKAIEELYDVKVKEVKIINVPSKRRQLGRFEGFKSGYKKAVVALKKGYKIEIA